MPFIIAHRGFSAKAPENTLASIKKAIDSNVDYIEIDVHLTKDLVPVVIHDPDLNRTSNQSSNLIIGHSDFESLKTVDLGSWFDPSFKSERLPTLKEVLNLDFKGAKLMIEIKKDLFPPELMVPHILQTVKSALNAGEPIPHLFGSFHPGIIKEIKKDHAVSKTIGILDNIAMIEDFLRMKVDILAIWHKILSPKLIKELRSEKIEIFSFTVNDRIKWMELVDWGIDGIISDNPQLCLSIPRELREEK